MFVVNFDVCAVKNFSKAKNLPKNSQKRRSFKYRANLAPNCERESSMLWGFVLGGFTLKLANVASSVSLAMAEAEYVTEKLLGTGRSAEVWSGRNSQTGTKVALKILPEDQLDLAMSEVAALERCRPGHRNVIGLVDYFQAEGKVYLVLECVNGTELFELVKETMQGNRPGLARNDALHIFAQIVSAVDFLHEKNVAHRDLKPDNIMITENREVKLVDFGVSQVFSRDTEKAVVENTVGSPHYMAPELYAEGKLAVDPFLADVWSLGVTLFVMLAGYLPWDGESLTEIQEQVQRGLPDFPKHIDADLQDLLRRMLERDSTKRCTLQTIQQHQVLERLIPTLRGKHRRSRSEGRSPLDGSIPEDSDLEGSSHLSRPAPLTLPISSSSSVFGSSVYTPASSALCSTSSLSSFGFAGRSDSDMADMWHLSVPEPHSPSSSIHFTCVSAHSPVCVSAHSPASTPSAHSPSLNSRSFSTTHFPLLSPAHKSSGANTADYQSETSSLCASPREGGSNTAQFFSDSMPDVRQAMQMQSLPLFAAHRRRRSTSLNKQSLVDGLPDDPDMNSSRSSISMNSLPHLQPHSFLASPKSSKPGSFSERRHSISLNSLRGITQEVPNTDSRKSHVDGLVSPEDRIKAWSDALPRSHPGRTASHAHLTSHPYQAAKTPKTASVIIEGSDLKLETEISPANPQKSVSAFKESFERSLSLRVCRRASLGDIKPTSKYLGKARSEEVLPTTVFAMLNSAPPPKSPPPSVLRGSTSPSPVGSSSRAAVFAQGMTGVVEHKADLTKTTPPVLDISRPKSRAAFSYCDFILVSDYSTNMHFSDILGGFMRHFDWVAVHFATDSDSEGCVTHCTVTVWHRTYLNYSN
eukprot:g68674.t1